MTRTPSRLSKVEEMLLDDTITFMEARETGKTSMKILAGKLWPDQLSARRKGRSKIMYLLWKERPRKNF